jgi:hypothetical protein
MHFGGRKHADETLALLVRIRPDNQAYHRDKYFTKAINDIVSKASITFTHSGLKYAIKTARILYDRHRATYNRRRRQQQQQMSSIPPSGGVVALLYPNLDREKAAENRNYSKCPSSNCSLRKMLNRYIGAVQEESGIVAYKGKLPKELRDMITGWTLVAEGISARQVAVGQFEVDTCQCLWRSRIDVQRR